MSVSKRRMTPKDRCWFNLARIAQADIVQMLGQRALKALLIMVWETLSTPQCCLI